MPDYQSAYRRFVKTEQTFLFYSGNHHHGHGQKRYQKLATATAMIRKGIRHKKGPVVNNTLVVNTGLELVLERINVARETFRDSYLPSILHEAGLAHYRVIFR